MNQICARSRRRVGLYLMEHDSWYLAVVLPSKNDQDWKSQDSWQMIETTPCHKKSRAVKRAKRDLLPQTITWLLEWTSLFLSPFICKGRDVTEKRCLHLHTRNTAIASTQTVQYKITHSQRSAAKKRTPEQILTTQDYSRRDEKSARSVSSEY